MEIFWFYAIPVIFFLGLSIVVFYAYQQLTKKSFQKEQNRTVVTLVFVALAALYAVNALNSLNEDLNNAFVLLCYLAVGTAFAIGQPNQWLATALVLITASLSFLSVKSNGHLPHLDVTLMLGFLVLSLFTVRKGWQHTNYVIALVTSSFFFAQPPEQFILLTYTLAIVFFGWFIKNQLRDISRKLIRKKSETIITTCALYCMFAITLRYPIGFPHAFSAPLFFGSACAAYLAWTFFHDSSKRLRQTALISGVFSALLSLRAFQI